MKNEKLTSGATQPAGKSSAPDAVLRKGDLSKTEQVVDAVAVGNAARNAIDVQLLNDGIKGTSSSPKVRLTNHWGRDEK